MSKAAALEAIRSIKKEARSMMAERMAARRKKRAAGDGIPAEEDPDDQLQHDEGGADPDDIGDDEGFNEEYPRDDTTNEGHSDNDMEDEELPSIIIHNGSRSRPIMPDKRGPGRPRKGY